MAFQKGKGRQVFVKPVGMPDLSGFREVANQYNQLSQSAMSIGTDIRKREYNDAIRQAEIDGKTAGVTYDQENNLVPLTNLDYGKESSLYSSSEQRNVLDVYRKAAITSYVSAASNDIRIAASQAYSESPNDPDKIRGSLSGYMQGLQKLDSEIYQSLAPKAVAEFTIAENKPLVVSKETSFASATDLISCFGKKWSFAILFTSPAKSLALLRNTVFPLAFLRKNTPGPEGRSLS